MNNLRSVLAGAAFLIVSFTPGIALADLNITVNNASFEILPQSGLGFTCGLACSYSVGPIPGWINGGDSGQFQPGSAAGNTTYFNNVPDGRTVAYSNGGTISQTVGATVNVGDTYTLFVSLGNRNDGFGGAGSADLLINGLRYGATGVQAASGEWTQWSASYTGLAADAGQSITIELNASGPQGDFDAVSLSEAPEPGSYAAIMLGVGGVMMAVRSRRAKRIAAV